MPKHLLVAILERSADTIRDFCKENGSVELYKELEVIVEEKLPTKAEPKRKKRNRKSARRALLKLVDEHGEVSRQQVMGSFIMKNFGGITGSNTLYRLVRDKALIKVGQGQNALFKRTPKSTSGY